MFISQLNIYNIIAVILLLFYLIQPLKASIVTTIKPLGLIATEIANEVMSVEILFPNSQSKYNKYLKPSVIKKIRYADLLICLGPEIEHYFFNESSSLSIKNVIQLNLLKEVNILLYKVNKIKFPKNFLISFNIIKTRKKNSSYLWLSPEIALHLATAIHHKLIKIIPNKKFKIDQNLKNFKTKLLQTKTIINLKLLPYRKKKYFLLHNSCQFFEKSFGLYPTKILSIHSNIQLSIKNVFKIKKELMKQRNSCLLTESLHNEKIIKFLIKDANIKHGTIDLLGIETPLKKNGYINFLLKLSNQYINCLKNI